MHNYFSCNRYVYDRSLHGKVFQEIPPLEHKPMRPGLALMLCFFAATLCAQESAQPSAKSPVVPYVERFEKQFNFFPGGKLQVLAMMPGDLKVIGWNKSSVRLEAERIVYYSSPEDAKALLQKFPIQVRYNQTSGLIQTAGSPTPPATMEINLTLYVPGEKTDLAIRISQGDLSLESVKGWIEATVREGSLDAKSTAGYFSGKIERGDIHVEMSGKRYEGYEFSAMTRQGSVELRLPKEYSAALQLETRDGKVAVHYPPREVEGELIPPQIVISKKGQSLKASVGDGGAPIRLVTYSGDVTLSLKE
jgi:DUF4097 and DUF4098 domain-containing protein YvlB